MKKELDEVFIIYGNQPDDMVFRLLEESSVLNGLKQDDHVFIKPNMVVSRKNWTGINTEPRVVEALVKALSERGIRRITVGDGSGMGQSASRAFEYCGYTDMAARYGFRLLDIEKEDFVSVLLKVEGPFRELEIARAIVESDIFINVPIMKAHSQTLLTCSLKNLKGAMPRHMKTRFHSVDLERAIAQLNSVLKPDIILVDGLRGDLHSELGGDPVVMDRMLLGTNPVAVDSVVAEILGYAPRDIKHIALAADAGLGTCDLNAIKLRALNRPAEERHFSPPPHYSERFPCTVIAEGACCTCTGNLVFALERLNHQGLLSKRIRIIAGQLSELPDEKGVFTVAVGSCVSKQTRADCHINECPPGTGRIYQTIAKALRNT